MDQQTIETLSTRLNKLERENRRLKRTESLMLVVIAGLAMMGQAQCNLGKTVVSKATKVVEAQEFIVRDANGKPRAKLTESELVFTDATGKERIRLGAGAAITSLSFTDNGGWPSVVLQSCSAKNSVDIPCAGIAYGTGLYLSSSEGIISLLAGNPSVTKNRYIGESPAQEPSLTIYEGVGLPNSKHSSMLTPHNLELWHANWPRIRLAVDDDGPSLDLLQAKMKRIWKAP